MQPLLTVSLRQKAVYIPDQAIQGEAQPLTAVTSQLASRLAKLGFGCSEALLQALNGTSPAYQLNVLQTVGEVMGIDKNWTPLVKGWEKPTGETVYDHIKTWFANIFGAAGTTLPCGHLIPDGSFPLERYNGCPFCGTPFTFSKLEWQQPGKTLKVLERWTEADATRYLNQLLTSKTALDATQQDSLRLLLSVLPMPDVAIAMKETVMRVVDAFVAMGQPEKALPYFSSPMDVLRWLWFKHTGFLQLIEPSTIVRRKAGNQRALNLTGNSPGAQAQMQAKAALKLKYGRATSAMVATWLNALPMEVTKMAEVMHPKRGMWVRFIRALRLPEYSKKPGFDKLRTLLDVFYKQEYAVWQAQINANRLRHNADVTLALLQQRPGLFARSLFANMLWFGTEPVMTAFAAIADKVPARLLATLSMYADLYFDLEGERMVKPLGGTSKRIPVNALLAMYEPEQLKAMSASVKQLFADQMHDRFAAQTSAASTIYIDPALYGIPLSIGDRSETVQDLPAALMGMRFLMEGDTVRLFMQWGQGLPAQHMDMDLSCRIHYADGRSDTCSFSNLATVGCKHSGDIRSIPNKIGTAEYIDIDVNELSHAGAAYVSFTCNAYSAGAITPNLVIGWMNAKHPMKISEATGVAYDPTCVQHQVRVVNGLSKGMLFGILDIATREIVWLEMAFSGQISQHMDGKNVQRLLDRLKSKMTIGQLLDIKASAQQLAAAATADKADEAYTADWAMNTAAVTQLLPD